MSQQKSDSDRLLDHLVGAGEDRHGHLDADVLRRSKIDHQFENRGLFDWNIRWLLAFKDLINIAGGEFLEREIARPMGDQPAVTRGPRFNLIHIKAGSTLET